MSVSAAEELIHWADRCRNWARRARSSEHRANLQSLEKILNQAALEAEDDLDLPRPFTPKKIR